MTTAAITIAIAIGAGHLMQYGLASSEEFQQPAPRPVSLRQAGPRSEATNLMLNSPLLPDLKAVETEKDIPDAPEAVFDPISFPVPALAPVVVPEDGPRLARQESLHPTGFVGPVCRPELHAEAAPGAVIRLDLRGCPAGTPVRVEHAGLSFVTSARIGGAVSVDIPAFQAEARVTVSVPGAPPATLEVNVPDAAWYDRVALSWDGVAPLSIHAFERGARPGGTGHVSAAHPRSPERADAAEGGFLTRLGEVSSHDKAAMAEVYSLPAGRMPGQGTVRLSVAAEVTEATCGREIPVRVLRATDGGAPRETTVPLSFPACEAVGSIVVLKNLLEDLKIARN